MSLNCNLCLATLRACFCLSDFHRQHAQLQSLPRRWLIQDTLKVLTYKLLYAFDIFQIKSGSFTSKDGHGPGTESLLGIQVCR